MRKYFGWTTHWITKLAVTIVSLICLFMLIYDEAGPFTAFVCSVLYIDMLISSAKDKLMDDRVSFLHGKLNSIGDVVIETLSIAKSTPKVAQQKDGEGWN